MRCDQNPSEVLFDAADPHFKVAHAAMDAAEAALQHHSGMMEGHLDRLVPALSQRLTDTKEVLRSAASGYATFAFAARACVFVFC